MRQIKISTSLLLSSFLLLTACSGSNKGNSTVVLDSSLAKFSLLATNTLEKGSTECANGGVKIDSGIDENENGELNPEEVTQSKIICNAGIALDSLIRIYDEPNGEHCEFGGKKILTGLDSDFNSELSEDEINDTQYLCNLDFTSLISSNPSSLVTIVEESNGENCSAGGKKINTGLDENNNGLLEDSEVVESSYLCNGESGVDGAITRSLQSITCNGPLENMVDFLWSYEIHQLTSGDAVVTASIYGLDTTVGSLAFYSGQELANNVKPAVNFIHDIVAPNNYGQWSIYLDDEQSKVFVVYNDSDLTPGPNVWSMTTDNCKTTIFE